LKATFDNQDEALWPGAFVNLRVIVAINTKAIAIPGRAVQRGPQGDYVYVIKPDDTVEMRSIKVSQVENDVAAVEQGLTAGERIVVDGQYRLDNGSKVSVEAPPAKTGS
jgi:multidrug efflux system membrane fusion protein